MAASIGSVFFKVGVNTAQFKQGLNTSVKSLRAWKAQAAKIARDAITPIDEYNQKFKELTALFMTGKNTAREYSHALEGITRKYFKATAGATAAAGATSKFAFATKAASAAVASLKASLTAVAAPLAVVFSVVKVLKAGEDIERAMRNSMTVFRGVSEEMKAEMKSLANEIAGETLFSTKELAEAYFFLGSAGLDAEQSLKALRSMANFAQAGMFDLSTATQLAATVQKTLGLRVKDPVQNLKNLIRVTDAFVGANTVAMATAEEFAESLSGKLGAALRLTNKSIEESVGLMGVLADAGIRGKDALSAAAIIMRGLQMKAVENAKAFKDMKIAVFDTDKEMRHMADIVSDLEKQLGGLAPRDQIEAIKKLGFTLKNIDFIRILIGTSAAMREYEERVKKMGGVTEDVAREQMTEFAKGWEAVKASFDNFALAFGPAMEMIGQMMLGFSQLLRAGIGSFDTWIERAEAAAKAGRTFLRIVAKAIEAAGFVGLSPGGASVSGAASDKIREFIKESERLAEFYKKRREAAKLAATGDQLASKAIEGAKKQAIEHSEEVTNAMAKLKKAYEDYGKTASDVNLAIVRASGDPALIKRAEQWVQSLKDQKKAEEGVKAAKKATKDVAKATQRIFDKLKSSAEQLRESLRTPQQVFEDEFARYNMFLNKKLLSEEEFIKAVRRARKKMIDPKETTTATRSSVTPALERFSQEAHKIIVGSTTSPEIQNQKKMIGELGEGNDIAEDILNELKNRPAFGVAPGVN